MKTIQCVHPFNHLMTTMALWRHAGNGRLVAEFTSAQQALGKARKCIHIYNRQSSQIIIPPNHHKSLGLKSKIETVSYTFADVPGNSIVRLCHPRSVLVNYCYSRYKKIKFLGTPKQCLLT